MRPEEIHNIAMALGSTVVKAATLAGGFSHETCLLTLADGQVVVRLGGPDPAIEAAVMAVARPFAPVPQVLQIVPPTTGGAGTDSDARPAMVLEYVAGTPLSEVLARGEHETSALRDLGAEVGRVVAGIAAVTFEHRGFFADDQLTVREAPPWSQQLVGFAETCMAATSGDRLDRSARLAWVDLCAANAPALKAIDNQSRLVHGDINPKNILVSRNVKAWRVDAVLDWEFGFSGCPYGDAANMTRFGADYPAGFVDGFRLGFAEHQPSGLPLAEEWSYLGRVLDMFALSDLVTRPADNPVADQAARLIRRWISDGAPAG